MSFRGEYKNNKSENCEEGMEIRAEWEENGDCDRRSVFIGSLR